MAAWEDDQMVEAVLTGDTDAFAGFVRKYQKPIFNLTCRTASTPETAADLTQDAFLKAFDKIHTYRPGRKFYSWIYALAMNTARDYGRRHRRQPQFTDEDLEAAVLQAAEDPNENEDFRSLRQIWGNLPLNDREAVLLRFRESMKMTEIAARLNLSVSSAKMRVHRGLEKLRQAWKAAGHDN